MKVIALTLFLATMALIITDHSRKTPTILSSIGLDSSGGISLSVVSVKSCCRPKIAIRNATLYPNLEISGAHDPCGKWAASSASATREKPMESPAANPRPRQRRGRSLEFFRPFATDRFIDNVRHNRQPLLDFLLLGARVDRPRLFQSSGRTLFFTFHFSSIIPWR